LLRAIDIDVFNRRDTNDRMRQFDGRSKNVCVTCHVCGIKHCPISCSRFAAIPLTHNVTKSSMCVSSGSRRKLVFANGRLTANSVDGYNKVTGHE